MPKWTPCEGTNLYTAEGKSLLFKSYTMGPHLLTFTMPSFVEMEKLKGEQRGVRQWTGPKPPGGGEQPDAEQRCQDTWQSSRSFLTPHCCLEYHCSSGPRTRHTSSWMSASTLSAPWHPERSSVSVSIIGSLYHHHFCYLWLLKLSEGYQGFWENYSSFTI